MEETERIYCIYRHTSPSGKSYVGQTKNYDRRCYEHQYYNSRCTALKRAIDKYGWDNFIHEILEENLTLEEANEREPYWIEFHDSFSPNGYNLTTGGLNYKMSQETIDKITGEGNSFFGKHHTPESLEKISQANIGENNSQFGKTGELSPNYGKTGELCCNYGRKHSDEDCNKISTVISGESNPFYGKTHSDETIQKLKEYNIGKSNGNGSTNPKYWIVIFSDGHEELMFGLHTFCVSNNLAQNKMRLVAKGLRKSHKGFRCRYATPEEIVQK